MWGVFLLFTFYSVFFLPGLFCSKHCAAFFLAFYTSNKGSSKTKTRQNKVQNFFAAAKKRSTSYLLTSLFFGSEVLVPQHQAPKAAIECV
jgi:hypothetical protein